MRRSHCALAGALLFSCTGRAAAPSVPPDGEVWLWADQLRTGQVAVVEVKEQEIPGALVLGGRVAFDEGRLAHVLSPLAGRITRVMAQPGDRVRKGTPLLALHSPDAATAFADLAKAEADLEQTRAEHARQLRLRSVEAGSARDLEAAEDALRKAEAEHARAHQRAGLLRTGTLDEATQELVLRSPIDGRVVARSVSAGMEVPGIYAGATPVDLFTIGDTERVWILADVPEMQLPHVVLGARAGVRALAWPDRVFDGTVDGISGTLDPATRTGRLRVSLANEDGALKPEMFTEVTLALPPRRGIAVPRGAVQRMGGLAFVQAAAGPAPGDRTRFVRRRVQVSEELGELAVVAEGLAPGERILVDQPTASLIDGSPLEITARQAERVGMRVEPVGEREVTEVVAASARLSFDDLRVAHVFSPVNGRVARLLAEPGQTVARGAPLLTLASPDVGSAFADAAKARAELVAAEHERRRQQELFDAHAGARRDLESAEDALRKARAELARAEQKTRLLNRQSFDAVTQEYTLRSPLAGEVVARTASPGLEVQGQWAGGGAPLELFTVGARDRLWVLGDVYEVDLPGVRIGAPVSVRVPAFPDRVFRGRVDWVADALDPATRTVRVRCSVENADLLLRPEMAPVLAISTPPRRLVAVPRSALQRMPDGVLVFVAEPRAEGQPLAFRARRVRTGDAGGDLVPVISGLAPRESIVTSGGIFLVGLL